MYVHQVCSLRKSTVHLSLSVHRNNINLAVIPLENNTDLSPLLQLIPNNVRNVLQIPRTLIFNDGVESACRIALRLRAQLPESISVIDPDIIIQVYHGCDKAKKSKTLSDIRSGRCRIAIFTDAFGLGDDIRDITRVIQCGIDEN